MFQILIKNWKGVGFIIIVISFWVSGVKYGRYQIESKQLEAIMEHKHTSDIAVITLDKEQKQIETEKAIKIRTVYIEKDNTNCIDADIPGRLFDTLHNSANR